MNKDIKQFEPKNIMKYFEEITKIPHGSNNEKQLSQYLASFLKQTNAEVFTDKNNNIIARKKATKGYEHLPMVSLQGHIDMVNVKTNDSNHDFSKDPLDIYEENGYIKANGTTLGADNGVAVACIMELFANDKIEHGPIEAILTTDEECGMTGANNLDFENIKGKYMINMDSEADDVLYIGCVGGSRCTGEMKFNSAKFNDELKDVYEISLTSCAGGHSGWEIYQKKINAIKEIFAILFKLSKSFEINLIEVNGGTFDNVIAQNCYAKIVIKKTDIQKIEKLIKEYKEGLKIEFADLEKEFDLTFTKPNAFPSNIISIEDSKKIINVVNSSFNGMLFYDFKYNVPDTSSNLGVITTKNNSILTKYYVRSPLKSSYQKLVNQIKSSYELGNYKLEVNDELAGWLPNYDNNKLAQKVKEIYKKMFNEDFKVGVMAGAVEAAIILEKCPMDCVSLGFKMFDIHSPKERVEIASIQKTWKFLIELLKNIE